MVYLKPMNGTLAVGTVLTDQGAVACTSPVQYVIGSVSTSDMAELNLAHCIPECPGASEFSPCAIRILTVRL